MDILVTRNLLYAAAVFYGMTLLLLAIKRDRAGSFILYAGILMHALFLAGRSMLGGVFIPNGMFDAPFLLPFVLAVIAAVYRRENHGERMVLPSMALFFTVLSLFHPGGIIPPTPQKVTVWAQLFFLTESMAHALFFCGAVLAVPVVLQRAEGADLPGPSWGNGYHTFLVWGFLAYSIAQVTGAVWSFLGWGNTFSWGARHMSSAAIWLIYAAYLHLRFLPEWNSRRRALFALASGIITAFMVFGHMFHEMKYPRLGG